MVTLKSLASLWCSLADSFSKEHNAKLVSPKDLHLVQTRSLGEGLQFLTAEMPGLASDIYESYKTSYLSVATRFKLKGKTSLPVFLNGYFSYLYDKDGALRELTLDRQQAHHELLQLLGLFKKLKVDFDPSVLSKSAEKLRATQFQLKRLPDFDTAPLEVGEVLRRARKLAYQVFRNVDLKDAIPKHGSGAVFDKRPHWEKFSRVPRFNAKIDRVYPYSESYFYSLDDFCLRGLNVSTTTDQVAGNAARVAFVPKTASGPRAISIEEVERQQQQQGQRLLIQKDIDAGRNVASGFINFKDQGVNRRKVSTAVQDNNATIDMSEASDRVTVKLVSWLFPPNVVECLHATRSDYTVLPPEAVKPPYADTIHLESFAPMGSAVCFPTEAIVFWCLFTACSQLGSNKPVYVYGDDIICNADDVPLIEEVAAWCGFVINTDKSYAVGPFRESCGLDQLADWDVTVARIRDWPGITPSSKQKRLQSLAGFINKLRVCFSVDTAEDMCRAIERELGTLFPRSLEGLHPYGVQLKHSGVLNHLLSANQRYNRMLQRNEIRLRSVRPVKRLARKLPIAGDADRLSDKDFSEVMRNFNRARTDKAFRKEALQHDTVLESGLYFEKLCELARRETPLVVHNFKKGLTRSDLVRSFGNIATTRPQHVFDVPNRTSECWEWFATDYL